MRIDRLLVIGCCLAATTFFAGCYKPNETAEIKSGSGGSAKPKASGPPIIVGTDIPDDSNSARMRTVPTAELLEEARKEEARKIEARKAAAAASASATAGASTSQPSATTPTATGAKPTGSSASSPNATGTPVAAAAPGASPSATRQFERPPMKPPVELAAAEVRQSRSPPPRTRVLAAPQAAGDVVGITFDSLMFDMKPTDPFSPTMLSDAVRGLFDKKVKIRGYFWPGVPFEKGITNFILVRDDKGCCFGPGALIYDNVMVSMAPGKTANFTTRPIAVEGVLTYREDRPGRNDSPVSIYHLEAQSVE